MTGLCSLTLAKRLAWNSWATSAGTFVSPTGFRCYLPAIARLAVDSKTEHLDQLLSHLRGNRYGSCSRPQRDAILNLLDALRDHVYAGIETGQDSPYAYHFEQIERRIEQLRNWRIAGDDG